MVARSDTDQQHIIFAESEQGLEQTLTLMLRQEKYGVTVVRDCYEAIAKHAVLEMEGKAIQLMIVDCDPPFRSDAAAALLQKSCFVPILLLSEYGDENRIHSLLKERCTIIQKPFEPQLFLESVKRCLRMRGGPGELRNQE